MAKQTINLGTIANDNTGDPIRTAFGKVNDNFDELYARAENTDSQTLTLTGDTLSISGGNSVDLSKYANTVFSGSYNDLTDTPTIPADISDLTDTTNLLQGGFSGSYNDLTDTPTIPADLSDLTDTTNLLFDGAYSSLTGAPTIPADISDLTDTTNLLVNANTLFDQTLNTTDTVEFLGVTSSTLSVSNITVNIGGVINLQGEDITAAGTIGATTINAIDFFGNLTASSADLQLSSNTDVNINTAVGTENHIFEFKNDGTFYMAKNPVNNESYISTPRNDTNANLTLTSALDVKVQTNESTGSLETWTFKTTGALEFPDATEQTTAWTGNAPGFTFNDIGGTTEIGVTADVFDFGNGKTIDMQNSSVLLTGSTVTGLYDQDLNTTANVEFTSISTSNINTTGGLAVSADLGLVLSGLGIQLYADGPLLLRSSNSAVYFAGTNGFGNIAYDDSNGNITLITTGLTRIEGAAGGNINIGTGTSGTVTIGNGSNTVDFAGGTTVDFANTTITGTGFLTSVAINDISDVNITSPSNGQVLKYNGSQWVNAADNEGTGGTGIALTDLSVGADDPASGSGGLAYNDTTGVFTYTPPALSIYATTDSLANVAISGAYSDLTGTPSIPANLSDLSDIASTPPNSGEVLKWNGSVWAPAADNEGAGGIALTDLSVSVITANGDGNLEYDNANGVFTFTPPDLSIYTPTANLASVATSGAYGDLTGTPTIPADVSDLTDNTNLLFDGAYSSLSGTPTIPADVSDLTDNTNLLSPPSRTTVSGTTASIADAATDNINITGFKSYSLMAIQTDGAAWVRIYANAASRTADAARLETVDPAPDAGVIAEVITVGAETVLISPAAIGFNFESPVTDVIPVAVTNKTGSTGTITVTLTVLQMES